jgi:hypothetical protein
MPWLTKVGMANRDKTWIEQERQRLLKWDRLDLIEWLKWVDPGGVWTDVEMEQDGMDPMSVADAVDHIMVFVAMNRKTPEEMISSPRPPEDGLYRSPDGARPDFIGTNTNAKTQHDTFGPKENPALDARNAGISNREK